MSHYENYSQTAGSYDTTRAAIGAEIWLGHLVETFGDLAKLRVLDAGCGTGNYMLALAAHVGHVTALDMNEEMLAEARQKATRAQLDEKIEFVADQMLDLPFEDGSFDAVMFNQVLHHLDPEEKSGFENLRGAMAEAARVVGNDGLIFINACSRVQMQRGYWYYSLIPGARQRGLDRTIGTQDLKDVLAGLGMGSVSRTVLLDALLLGEANFNARGPLDAAWRAGDSIWALASDDELAAALTKIAEMERDGLLEAYMNDLDDDRRLVGQTTFWCARGS